MSLAGTSLSGIVVEIGDVPAISAGGTLPSSEVGGAHQPTEGRSPAKARATNWLKLIVHFPTSCSDTLAALVLAASLFLALLTPGVVAAQDQGGRLQAAAALYATGKPDSARGELVQLLDDATVADPILKVRTLITLLQICTKVYDPGCVLKYGNKYFTPLVNQMPEQAVIQKREFARSYLLYTNIALSMTSQHFQDPTLGPAAVNWKYTSLDGPLYLEHESFVGSTFDSRGDIIAADSSVDRSLSFVASVSNPQYYKYQLASSLANSIETLSSIGETERAYGIYKSVGNFIVQNLPEQSLEAAIFRYVEGSLLEEVGDLPGSKKALDFSLSILRQTEVADSVREYFIGADETLEAVVCVAMGSMDCATTAIANHPYAKLYSVPGRRATSYAEITYLTARALVAAVNRRTDPVVSVALTDAPESPQSSRLADREEIYRKVGLALALPLGPERSERLAEVGKLEVDASRRMPVGAFGAWYRSGTIDQLITALALEHTGTGALADADTAFRLFQLARRGNSSFDEDALTVLSRASSPESRRAIHEALRLRSRRDRLERQSIQDVVRQANTNTVTKSGPLADNFLVRQRLRQFSVRVQAVLDQIGDIGLQTSGADTVSLHDFQTKLGPNEVALSVAPLPGGAAYQCIRRDRTSSNTVFPVDWKQANLDSRLLMDALTATNAPSPQIDGQFPVQASIRLYNVLLRPLEGCIQSTDHIIWLPGLSLTTVPLAILLREPPPKTPDGYDLGKADWLVRHHSVSYAGAASVIVAARSTQDRTRPDFDFLGVGDPLLSGTTSTGEDRSTILSRGIGGDPATLPALPDTKSELEASARHFESSTILLQGNATKRSFNSELAGAYRLMSFATHGVSSLDGQGLSDPSLVLTPVTATDPADNGLLSASEIADLDLSATFVALSACNTATIDPARLPEDLPALSSAFAVAGVPATLGTLWSVDSDTTTRIVSDTFARISAHPDQGTAEDLAEAQRAFLLNVPGPAYLHPRFWAAFIILGDGDTSAATQSGRTPVTPDASAHLRSISVVANSAQSEVLGFHRFGGSLVARFIAEPNANGRYGSGVLMIGANGQEKWRRVNWDTGATRFVYKIGTEVAAGGFQSRAYGHWDAVIEEFDSKTGTTLGIWKDKSDASTNGSVIDGVQTGVNRVIFLVAHAPLNIFDAPDSAKLDVFDMKAGSDPTLMFSTKPPKGFSIDAASISINNGTITLTYTDRFSRQPSPTFPEDDYDTNVCALHPTTWIETRDAKSFNLSGNTARMDDVVITNSIVSNSGKIVFSGSLMNTKFCEPVATLFTVDATGAMKAIYKDSTIGSSEFTALSNTSYGGVCAVGQKDTKVDFLAVPMDAQTTLLAEQQLQNQNEIEGGLASCLSSDGNPKFTRTLGSGGDIYLNSIDSTNPMDMLIGGSIGSHAVIVHLEGALVR
jgi:CHAT domain-containing protein